VQGKHRNEKKEERKRKKERGRYDGTRDPWRRRIQAYELKQDGGGGRGGEGGNLLT